MKSLIISYSLSGNNEELAKSLSQRLKADHVRVLEAKPRKMGTIILDLIFNRTPKIRFPKEKVGEYDFIIFVGPVWIGNIATPFRKCFKELASEIKKYAYVTICGGAEGTNTKIKEELVKRLGKDPLAVIDLHIAELLPPEPEPTKEMTMAYKISEEEIKQLTDKAEEALKKIP